MALPALWNNSLMTTRPYLVDPRRGCSLRRAAGFWLARELDSSGPELASGTGCRGPSPIADFHLIDNLGKPFSLRDLQGKPTLVFFGFTRCPECVPHDAAEAGAGEKDRCDFGSARGIRHCRPGARHTTAVGLYVHAFDPDFIGLTGDEKSINRMAADFGVAVSKVDLPGGDYTMDHSRVVFLLNNQGQVAGFFTPPFDIPRLAADLDRAAPTYPSPEARDMSVPPLAVAARPVFVAMQHVLPQHFLSRIVLRVTRIRLWPVKSLLIRSFLRGFKVNMSEAAQPNPLQYPSFNAFFTRALRHGARATDIDPGALVSPWMAPSARSAATTARNCSGEGTRLHSASALATRCALYGRAVCALLASTW